MRYVPVIAILLAGLIHLALAPQHYAHAPAHGIFFVLAGATESLWALAFWRRPSPRFYSAGLALAGGLVVLWAITRVFLSPFEHEAGPVDVGGLVCKGSELIGVVTLVILALQGRLNDGVRRPALRSAAEALALALVLGLGAYGIGHAAEPLLPMLGPQEEHAPAHMHEAATPGPEAATPGVLVTLGHLQIEEAWARPAQAGDMTAVYLTIVNTGDHADALVAVHFDGAEMAEIDESRMEGDVMQMRPVASLEIPAGGTVELKPGGYHIMLMNLKHDLTAGEHASLTLEFEHSGQVAIEAEVAAP